MADWRPTPSAQKIKKDGSGKLPQLEWTENPDILAAVAAMANAHPARRPFCVGFAAESQDLARHARDKLVRKGVPLVVGNIGPATFGRDDNSLLLVDAAGDLALPAGDKLDLARALVAEIAQRLAGQGGRA